MAKTINPPDLADAIERELTLYHEGVAERVNDVGSTAIAKLKRLTKASAPVAGGSFKRHIATKEQTHPVSGMKSYVWYVKPPDHRITHLLVHGHATRTGGRTRANPFLKNAVDTVLPEYEAAVKEALKK